MARLVRDVMTPGVVTCQGDTALVDVARLMVEHSTSAVAVVDAQGTLCGIVSLTDLVRASLHPQVAATAELVMSSHVATAIPDIPIFAATQMLLDRTVHQLIIQESPTSQRPVGILSMEDIVRDMARSATTKGDV